MKIEDRIERIKSIWFLVEPIYFMIICTHKIEIDPELKCSISCGCGSIFINPDFFKNKSDEILEEFLKMELVRILLKHPYTRQQPIVEYSYIASNIVLGNNMKFNNINVLSAKSVFGNSEKTNESLEYYYALLADNFKNNESDNKDSGNGSSSYNKFDDACESMQDAFEKASKWQEDTLKVVEINQMIEKTDASNTWGSIPGEIVDEIRKTLKPKFDYKAVFKQFRSTLLSSCRILTRMRPNRRFGYTYMGSKRSFTTKILVAVDTSASISDEELTIATGFINGFFTYGVERIDAIEFDTKIYPESLTTFNKKFKRMKITGRGGTDFNDIFKYVYCVSKEKYDGVIIFTDGYAAVPSSEWYRKSQTNFLWCINSENNFSNFIQTKEFRKFGRITHIK